MGDIYNGTEGDDALEAGLDIMDGTEDWRDGWKSVNKTRDMVARVRTWINDTLAALWPLPVTKGGTGSTTPAGAAVALGVWRNSGAVANGFTPLLGWNGARLQYEIPGYIGAVNLANLSDIPAPQDVSSIYNGLLSPSIYGRTLAGWRTVAIQADGTLGQTSSALRFKENVVPLDVTDEQIRRLELVEFDWKSDGSHDVGLIADEVEKVAPWAVFHDENGLVLGIHYERLAFAILPALQRALDRLDALEAK